MGIPKIATESEVGVVLTATQRLTPESRLNAHDETDSSAPVSNPFLLYLTRRDATAAFGDALNIAAAGPFRWYLY